MPYIGKSPGNGVRQRYIYAATAGQTSFSGNDSAGISLAYDDPSYLDVYQNGVLLKPVTDYASTTGTSVVLVTGATTDDVVEMITYDTFAIADTVSAKDGGSFAGAVSMASTLNVAGAFTSLGIDDNADATAITIDSSEKVGIGTAPTQKLQIHEASSGANFMQVTNSTTGATSGDGLFVGLTAAEIAYFWHAEDNDIHFGLNNTLFQVLNNDAYQTTDWYDANGNNWAKLKQKDGIGRLALGIGNVTLADDASIVVHTGSTGSAGAGILCVYQGASGQNAVYATGYVHSAVLSQTSGNQYATSDTDGKYCLIVSQHDITFKNRIGSSASFRIGFFNTAVSGQ